MIQDKKELTKDQVILVGVEMLNQVNFFPLFTKQELANRWGVSRQVVQKRCNSHTNFCKPVTGFIKGSGSYYPLYEVERYEKEQGIK